MGMSRGLWDKYLYQFSKCNLFLSQHPLTLLAMHYPHLLEIFDKKDLLEICWGDLKNG